MRFAQTVARLDADVVVAQPFHTTRGRFAAGTLAPALELAKEYGWDARAYAHTVQALRQRVPLCEGRVGFQPE